MNSMNKTTSWVMTESTIRSGCVFLPIIHMYKATKHELASRVDLLLITFSLQTSTNYFGDYTCRYRPVNSPRCRDMKLRRRKQSYIVHNMKPTETLLIDWCNSWLFVSQMIYYLFSSTNQWRQPSLLPSPLFSLKFSIKAIISKITR